MTPLLLFVFLLLNAGISAWNAYAAGAFWTESKVIGGWMRFVTWCAVVMSACGFTWCYLTLLTMVAVGTETLTPEQGLVMFELGYLVILLPLLGSGLGIWAHSIAEAYRRRSFGSIAVAGWNTYAQAQNMFDAARHAPGILRHVMDALGSGGKRRGKKDEAGAVLIVLLVILAVCGGALTTAAIVRWADRRVALDVGSLAPQRTA